jgi:probable rRNA maturation factor
MRASLPATTDSFSEPSRGQAAGSAHSPAAIEVLNRQRRRAIDCRQVARLARLVFDRIKRPEATATITFTRDHVLRRLNRDYREIDRPTDVLSFAYHESSDDAGPEPDHLGDIVISVDTAERDARRLGLTFEREISHLVIHGALHLAGYDHETDHGEMSRLEARLRRELLSSGQ